uniref:Interleukin n=1 Tax=Meleagris gallopavo TaxID=9103 RepID=Q9IAC7_MELGA|nr:interleukin-2 [Meleagris gallopavo]
MMCKVLIFSCISVALLMTTAYGASLSPEKLEILPALIKDLEILEESKNKIHVVLYTPNEIKECSQQTLQCYLEEMVMLKKEIEDEPEIKNEFKNALQNIKKNLHRLKDLSPTGGECKICEANDKKNFPDFLQQLTNLLRSMHK